MADLILTDDSAALDALPERVRAELLAPLFAVSRALDEQRDLPHLRAAVGALKSAAAATRAELPDDLRQPIQDLRFVSARLDLHPAHPGTETTGSFSSGCADH